MIDTIVAIANVVTLLSVVFFLFSEYRSRKDRNTWGIITVLFYKYFLFFFMVLLFF